MRERIAAACARAGRSPADVRLVAVTKTIDAATTAELVSLGATDVGENRADALESKRRDLAARGVRCTWHMIGHLQTNKVRQVLAIAHLIHSIDSVRLAERIVELASPHHPVEILLQVNTSGEATKFGVAPPDLRRLAEIVKALPGLAVRGLMTLGPLSEDPLVVRASFRHLRALSDELRSLLPDASILSMGMSGDFEIAIEEGATHVRIGTALFGERG